MSSQYHSHTQCKLGRFPQWSKRTPPSVGDTAWCFISGKFRPVVIVGGYPDEYEILVRCEGAEHFVTPDVIVPQDYAIRFNDMLDSIGNATTLPSTISASQFLSSAHTGKFMFLVAVTVPSINLCKTDNTESEVER